MQIATFDGGATLSSAETLRVRSPDLGGAVCAAIKSD
jgi:hypothetical protein